VWCGRVCGCVHSPYLLLTTQHHLERVLKHLQAEKDPDAVGLDARLLLTAMSLGLKAKAADRVAPLFAIFSPDGETMSVDDFISCIGMCAACASCTPCVVALVIFFLLHAPQLCAHACPFVCVLCASTLLP